MPCTIDVQFANRDSQTTQQFMVDSDGYNSGIRVINLGTGASKALKNQGRLSIPRGRNAEHRVPAVCAGHNDGIPGLAFHPRLTRTPALTAPIDASSIWGSKSAGPNR